MRIWPLRLHDRYRFGAQCLYCRVQRRQSCRERRVPYSIPLHAPKLGDFEIVAHAESSHMANQDIWIINLKFAVGGSAPNLAAT